MELKPTPVWIKLYPDPYRDDSPPGVSISGNRDFLYPKYNFGLNKFEELTGMTGVADKMEMNKPYRLRLEIVEPEAIGAAVAMATEETTPEGYTAAMDLATDRLNNAISEGRNAIIGQIRRFDEILSRLSEREDGLDETLRQQMEQFKSANQTLIGNVSKVADRESGLDITKRNYTEELENLRIQIEKLKLVHLQTEAQAQKPKVNAAFKCGG